MPAIEVQVIRDHHDEVLHVAFSHNGQIFVTCSKDGLVKTWNCDSFPFNNRCQVDMRPFSWNYAQFSAFNQSDTLLMVSGVHLGPLSHSGELVIFSVRGKQDGLEMQCKVCCYISAGCY